MLLPGIAGHTSNLWRGTFFVGIGIGSTYLWLLAITSDVEAVQLDEYRLTYRECTIETALTNADSDGASIVLYIEAVVDVATYVVTSHQTHDLHRLSHLFQAIAIDFGCKESLHLGNGLKVGSLDVLITIGRHTNLVGRSIPTAFHARCGQS